MEAAVPKRMLGQFLKRPINPCWSRPSSFRCPGGSERVFSTRPERQPHTPRSGKVWIYIKSIGPPPRQRRYHDGWSGGVCKKVEWRARWRVQFQSIPDAGSLLSPGAARYCARLQPTTLQSAQPDRGKGWDTCPLQELGIRLIAYSPLEKGC